MIACNKLQGQLHLDAVRILTDFETIILVRKVHKGLNASRNKVVLIFIVGF